MTASEDWTKFQAELKQEQRNLAQLRGDLQNEQRAVERCRDDLRSLHSGFLALNDEKFPANVYRSALQAEMRSEIYARVMKVVALMGLILSAGGIAVIQLQVQGRIGKVVQDVTADVESARLDIRRGYFTVVMLSNDKEILQSELQEVGGSYSNAEFEAIAKEILVDPRSYANLRAALQFWSMGESLQLERAAVELVGNANVPGHWRQEVCDEVLGRKGSSHVGAVLRAVPTLEEGSSAWLLVIEKLAEIDPLTLAPKVRKELVEMMGQLAQTVSAADWRPEASACAVVFLALMGEDQAGVDFGSLNSRWKLVAPEVARLAGIANTLSGHSIGASEAEDQASAGGSRLAFAAWLDEHAESGSLLRSSQYDALVASVAYGLLEQDLKSGSIVAARDFAYEFQFSSRMDSPWPVAESRLCAVVQSKFAGVLPAFEQWVAIQDDDSFSYMRFLSAWASVVDAYSWNEELRLFQPVEEPAYHFGASLSDQEEAIRDLAEGELDRFIELMDSDYFLSGVWASQVEPRFPQWVHNEARDVPVALGFREAFLLERASSWESVRRDLASRRAQDDLWNWVRGNRDQLEFDGSAFRLAD